MPLLRRFQVAANLVWRKELELSRVVLLRDLYKDMGLSVSVMMPVPPFQRVRAFHVPSICSKQLRSTVDLLFNNCAFPGLRLKHVEALLTKDLEEEALTTLPAQVRRELPT